MILILWQVIFLWGISFPAASLLMNNKPDVYMCMKYFEDILDSD